MKLGKLILISGSLPVLLTAVSGRLAAEGVDSSKGILLGKWAVKGDLLYLLPEQGSFPGKMRTSYPDGQSNG